MNRSRIRHPLVLALIAVAACAAVASAPVKGVPLLSAAARLAH